VIGIKNEKCDWIGSNKSELGKLVSNCRPFEWFASESKDLALLGTPYHSRTDRIYS
jgi:hypothetical protein